MSENKPNLVSFIGNLAATVGTIIQTDKLLQYISLALTIISVIITIAFNIYKWVKSATADKKITDEEIKEGVDIIKSGVDEINQVIKDNQEDKGDKDNGDNN